MTARGGTGTVRDAALSPDGKVIVSGGTDRRALLWNLETRRDPARPGPRGRHRGVDGLVARRRPRRHRAQGRSIRVWDARDGSLPTVLRDHQDWVVGLFWSPSGRMIASCSDDRTARVPFGAPSTTPGRGAVPSVRGQQSPDGWFRTDHPRKAEPWPSPPSPLLVRTGQSVYRSAERISGHDGPTAAPGPRTLSAGSGLGVLPDDVRPGRHGRSQNAERGR